MRFRQLSVRARTYLLAVCGAAAVIALVQWLTAGRAVDLSDTWHWRYFAFVAIAAAAAHSFPVSTPDRQSFHVSHPFFMAAIVLMPPLQVSLLAVVVHAAELLRRRRSWYGQLFNVATYIVSTA